MSETANKTADTTRTSSSPTQTFNKHKGNKYNKKKQHVLKSNEQTEYTQKLSKDNINEKQRHFRQPNCVTLEHNIKDKPEVSNVASNRTSKRSANATESMKNGYIRTPRTTPYKMGPRSINDKKNDKAHRHSHRGQNKNRVSSEKTRKRNKSIQNKRDDKSMCGSNNMECHQVVNPCVATTICPDHSEHLSQHHASVKLPALPNQLLIHLPWLNKNLSITLSVEQSLLPTLMHWGKTEWGMIKDQPPHRLHKISKLCRERNIPILTALSLRRHHLKQLNPNKTYARLGLGTYQDIRGSALKFEEAVKAYLTSHGIGVLTETEQRDAFLAEHCKLDQSDCGDGRRPPLPPTPDFLLTDRVCLISKGGNRGDVSTMEVFWIEAKMFYGANSMEWNEDSAMGGILPTAEKYVNRFGPGAMVFSYGCGRELVDELGKRGVLALDAGPLDLNELKRHQRTWCGDEKGRILF